VTQSSAFSKNYNALGGIVVKEVADMLVDGKLAVVEIVINKVEESCVAFAALFDVTAASDVGAFIFSDELPAPVLAGTSVVCGVKVESMSNTASVPAPPSVDFM
jgi:hypothetical protein